MGIIFYRWPQLRYGNLVSKYKLSRLYAITIICLYIGEKRKEYDYPADEDLVIEPVEKVAESIVNIANVRMVQDQLFRLFPIEGEARIIIDGNGLILTNNHVVDKANNLKSYTWKDGNIFNGKVMGTDEISDLAVVKVEEKIEQSIANGEDSESIEVAGEGEAKGTAAAGTGL